MTQLLLALLTCLAAGCSPYVYKTEISNFSSGITTVAEAYTNGMRALAAERTAAQAVVWTDERARLTPTPGCRVGGLGAPESDEPCGLIERGQPLPGPSASEATAIAAAPVVKAIRDYGVALAAVTNAADREALNTATSALGAAVKNLATVGERPMPPALAAGFDLGAWLIGAALDARRFQVLRGGVGNAAEPIRTLADTLGRALEAIRLARGRELADAAVVLGRGLGPDLTVEHYAGRLAALQATIANLETLRRQRPSVATADLIKAHDVLVLALQDDFRQFDALTEAISSFVEKATALHEALTQETSGAPSP